MAAIVKDIGWRTLEQRLTDVVRGFVTATLSDYIYPSDTMLI